MISIMARSTTRSNQQPDTLMQDRTRQDRRNLLHRTAGPYIEVKSGAFGSSDERPLYLPSNSGAKADIPEPPPGAMNEICAATRVVHVAAIYSITSSASASNLSGIVRP